MEDHMDNLEQILQEDNLGMDPSSLKLLSNDGQDAIYYLAVPGAEAVDRWRALRGLVKETHYWPVLLGTDEDVGFHEDASEDKDHPPTSNIIEDALTIDPVAWLRRDRRAELSFLLDSMAQTMGKEEFASLREQLLDEEEFGDKPPHG